MKSDCSGLCGCKAPSHHLILFFLLSSTALLPFLCPPTSSLRLPPYFVCLAPFLRSLFGQPLIRPQSPKMPGALRRIGGDDDGDDDDRGSNNWAHCDESVEAAGRRRKWWWEGGCCRSRYCVSTFNFQMALSRKNVFCFFLLPLLFRRLAQGSGSCSRFLMQRVSCGWEKSKSSVSWGNFKTDNFRKSSIKKKTCFHEDVF